MCGFQRRLFECGVCDCTFYKESVTYAGKCECNHTENRHKAVSFLKGVEVNGAEASIHFNSVEKTNRFVAVIGMIAFILTGICD